MSKTRTTLLLDADLMYEAKKAALERRITLTAWLEETLRKALHATKPRRRKFKPWPTHGQGGLLPGVDLEDKEQIDRILEGY